MLTVTFDINGRKIGTLDVINITPNDSGRMSSDYLWRIKRKPRGGDKWAEDSGYMVDSYENDAVKLVSNILFHWWHSTSDAWDYPIDNHGNAKRPEPISSAEAWRRYDEYVRS